MSGPTRTLLFPCPSCTQRLLSAIRVIHPHRSSSPFANSGQYASHATFASLRKGHHRRALSKTIKLAAKGKQIPWSNRRFSHGPVKWERKSMVARNLNNAHMEVEKSDRGSYNLFKELEYSGNDPLIVAQIVRRGLQSGQLEEAVEIARRVTSGRLGKVDRAKDYIVSWNHLIDYFMVHGRPKSAMRLYGEMKERGINPSAHTYTIVLHGLGRNPDKSTKSFSILEQAMKVFQHMQKRFGKELSSIHRNALLNVCANLGDMDALWKVAGTFDEHGTYAPDAATYTTIIRSLSRHVEDNTREDRGRNVESQPSKRKERDPRVVAQFIKDGEALWQDIMHRWRSGDLKMDESLVCVMASLYLKGTERKDWGKVFGLIEDTIGVVNAENHEFAHFPSQDRASTDNTATRGNKVVPGQRTLSVIMSACIQLRLKKAATDYWDLLTSPSHAYQIQPDAANCLDFMRVLRIARSSTETVGFLTQLKTDPRTGAILQLWRRSTFAIALSTCKRDVFNRNAFHNANMIMDIMLEKIPPPCTDHQATYPTPDMLQTYLDLGIGLQSGSQETVSPSRITYANAQIRARNLLKTVPRLFPYLETLPDSELNGSNYLLRDFVGACDRLLNHKDVDSLDSQDLEEIRSMKQLAARLQFEVKTRIKESGLQSDPQAQQAHYEESLKLETNSAPKYERSAEGRFASFKDDSKYRKEMFDVSPSDERDAVSSGRPGTPDVESGSGSIATESTSEEASSGLDSDYDSNPFSQLSEFSDSDLLDQYQELGHSLGFKDAARPSPRRSSARQGQRMSKD